MKKLLSLLALTLALLTPCYGQILSPILFGKSPTGGGGGSGNALVSAQTLGTARNDYTGCVGFRFTVGASPITVTDLGRWVISGNSGTHTVYVVDNTGAVMVSGSVNTSGATAGQYKYVSVTPTVLSASTVYGLESDETYGADQWYSNDTTITLTGVATYQYAFSSGCPGSAGANSTGGTSYGPVNLKY